MSLCQVHGCQTTRAADSLYCQKHRQQKALEEFWTKEAQRHREGIAHGQPACPRHPRFLDAGCPACEFEFDRDAETEEE